MNLEEAVKVAKVLCTADGGCGHCAQALAENIQTLFPDFDWKVLVKAEFDSEDARWADA